MPRWSWWAAVSVRASSAEGPAQRGNREFRRCLDIANGSIPEIQVYLLLAKELGYLRTAAWGTIEALGDPPGLLTWGLYRSVSDAQPAPLSRRPAHCRTQ